jgi:hypothetical protein
MNMIAHQAETVDATVKPFNGLLQKQVEAVTVQVF